jgi:hypothetical protein
MDKKPLIGVSIFVVVLLVLDSLSIVVGYQSMTSTSSTESPLFIMRATNAINQKQNIITTQYLGLGKGTLLQFPTRDNRNEPLKKILEIINEMDDKTIERFAEVCIQKIILHDSFPDMNFNAISQVFRQLKEKPEANMNTFISENNSQTKSLILPTSAYITVCGRWAPGCILQAIITSIIAYLSNMFQWPTYTWFCISSSGQVPCNFII